MSQSVVKIMQKRPFPPARIKFHEFSSAKKPKGEGIESGEGGGKHAPIFDDEIIKARPRYAKNVVRAEQSTHITVNTRVYRFIIRFMVLRKWN